MRIEIYDPPMCCSTGVCGPNVDPTLIRFAADLEWLHGQGVEVERYNLSRQPAAFANAKIVKEALAKDGNDCLPLIVIDNKIVSKGSYPTRQVLAGFAGLTDVGSKPGVFTDAVRELVAIGASIASNCEPCFKYHYNEARKLGVSKDDMRLAVEMAQAVKDSPSRSVLALAQKYLNDPGLLPVNPCCGEPGDKDPGGCCGS